MALVECKECGGQVSDTAPICPHCGMVEPGIWRRIIPLQVAVDVYKRDANIRIMPLLDGVSLAA